MPSQTSSDFVPLVDRILRDGVAAGIMMLNGDDVEYSGRQVDIGGKTLLNFGGCGYLDLEQSEELKEGAISAVRRYGTQFPFSRAYLQAPLYEQLEAAMDAVTGHHVLVTPSTTLAHMAALPVLVRPGDAVIVDRFAHASVHAAISLLGPIPLTKLRHADMAAVEETVARLSGSHERVHYLLDGVYSMHGDVAPLAAINRLLAAYPKLHLYIDDAHSMSCAGTHGRGRALEHMPDLSRTVVALSLNKAFGAAGGALVFSSAEERDLVRRCGSLAYFTGPIQPPMLGAALASARLHLCHEFDDRQRALDGRIKLVQDVARDLRVPLANDDATPIFFVPCGRLEKLIPMVQAMLAAGLYVCTAGFPTVPLDEGGVRFTVSLHNTPDDVSRLLQTVAKEMRSLGIPMRGEARSARPPTPVTPTA